MYSHETKVFVKKKIVKLKCNLHCLALTDFSPFCPKSGTKAILINYRRRKALAGAWIYKFRKLSWQKCNGILNKRTKETVQYKRFGIKCIVVKGYIVELNKWDRESITALHFLYVFRQWSVINAYPYSVITIWAKQKISLLWLLSWGL